MPPADDDFQNNAMQQHAGLIPPMMMPQGMAMSPMQTASAISSYLQTGAYGGGGMGGGGQFPNAFPQQYPTFTTTPPFMQGPGGVMMPMPMAAPSNPFMTGGGMPMGRGGPSMYQQGAAAQPPAYAGMQGQAPVLFAPQSPPGFFDTPFQTAQRQMQMTTQRQDQLAVMGQGMAARMGTNALAGVAGGMMGGPLGAVGGFLGSEMLGLGRGAQNMFMRNFGASQLNTQASGAAIQDISSQFISGGGSASPMGSGFSRSAAMDASRMLTSMSGSREFRNETFNRFNTSDVMKITQESAGAGLLQGSQSPEQMRDRVRQISRSLTQFMELAQEPDLRRAIQTMGNMQMQGLNIHETMQAVRNGRSFARAAGTTFGQMAELGGGMGAQTYQSVGLSQGVGFQSGMQNLGLAGMSQNLRTLSPQMMNLVGGQQGLAGMNTMFSAGFLQQPMMAPGVMSARGGIDVNAMRQMMTGGADVFGMTGRGAGTMGQMAGRMGPEGLGMALAMQPMIQDTMGRMMQSQGPFAQRNIEDQSMMNLSRSLGQRGSAGFITAAQMSGMGQSQAVARAMEMASPRFYERQRQQITTQYRERASEMQRERDARRPGFLDELTDASETVAGARRGLGRAGQWFRDTATDIFGGENRTFFGGMNESDETARSRRELMRTPDSQRSFEGFQQRVDQRERARTPGFGERYTTDRRLAEARGDAGIVAGVRGLMGMDPAERERQTREVTERRDFSQGVLSARRLTDRQQVETQQRVFGGAAGYRQFEGEAMGILGGNQRDRQLRMGINATWGAGVGLVERGLGAVGTAAGITGVSSTGGIQGQRDFDVGAIRQSAVENIMRGRGVGRPEAERLAQEQMPEMQSMLRRSVETYGTIQQRESLERAWGRGQGVGDRSQSIQVQAEADIRQGFSRMTGIGIENNARGAGVQRAIEEQLNRQGSGVGRTPQQRAESRSIMAAAGALAQVAQNRGAYTAEDQARASQQLRNMRGELERRGWTSEQAETIMHRAAMTNAAHPPSPDVRQWALNMAQRGSVRDVVTDIVTGGRQVTEGGVNRDIAMGVERLARGPAAEAAIFHSRNREEIENRLTQAGGDPEALRRIQVRPVREAAEMFARGDRTAGRAALSEFLRTAGTQDTTRRREQENVGVLTRLRRFMVGASGEEMQARAGMAGGDADVQSLNQIGQVNRTERQAESAGMGGANDQLLTAARELREAARLLSGNADRQEMDNLTQ